MVRYLRPFAGLLFLALIAVSACDNETTTPTPTPAPTPPPATPPPAPPPPPPAAPAALESLTLSESTVPSQSRPTATIRLTAPAPAGNASIALETTNTDVAKVPANISIAAGQTSTTFAIETSTVRSATQVTIEARYLGVAARAILTVVPPGVNANFRVFSPSVGAFDVCHITSGAGAVDCLLDASLSTGIISVYRWTLAAAGKELTFTLADSQASFTPATTCSFLGGGSLNSDGTLPMAVTLRVQDREGNVSNPFTKNVSVAPNGNCGY